MDNGNAILMMSGERKTVNGRKKPSETPTVITLAPPKSIVLLPNLKWKSLGWPIQIAYRLVKSGYVSLTYVNLGCSTSDIGESPCYLIASYVMKIAVL